MRGTGQFGEDWRAVEMISEHTPRTVAVDVLLRQQGSEEPTFSHTINQPQAVDFTTQKEAVEEAVRLHVTGQPAKVDHMPDGRVGGNGARTTLVGPVVLAQACDAMAETIAAAVARLDDPVHRGWSPDEVAAFIRETFVQVRS